MAYSGAAFSAPTPQPFGYNDRNELTSSSRSGTSWTYQYDPIGNRVMSRVADDPNDPNATYLTNSLNQYYRVQTLSMPRLQQGLRYDDDGNLTEYFVAADMNCDGVIDFGDINPFVTALNDPNAYAQQFPNCDILNGDINGDGVVNFADLNPFITLQGGGGTGLRTVYTYDAENRLIGVGPGDDVTPTEGTLRLSFRYDYLGRRVWKQVQTYTDGQWPVTAERKFVWSGWLLLVELDTLADDASLRRYTWGLDLAGQMGGAGGVGILPASLESAGGIGGLLAVEQPQAGGGALRYVYFYDANGNVGQVINPYTTNPANAIKAKYEYDPSGQRTNTPAAGECDQPWRFSTKQFDAETGLGYWGYRYYSPGLGRWMSRDPIGLSDGPNELAYVRNRPTVAIDPLGLDIYQAPRPDFVKKACGKCGADITDWFRDEFEAQKSGWDAYKAEYERRATLGIGWYQYAWWAYHNQYYKSWSEIMLAPHPSGGQHFEFNKGTTCGTKGKCDVGCGNTVTLCGKCIHSSVVGNLMFGLMANYAQQSLDEVTKYVREIINRYGTPDPYDPPIYKVGYDVYGDYDDFASGGSFCEALMKAEAAQGVSAQWLGGETRPTSFPRGAPSAYGPMIIVQPTENGVSDRSSCEPCTAKTTETAHGRSARVEPWGRYPNGG